MRRGTALLLALLLMLLCVGCGEDENVIKGAGHSFSYTLVGNPDTLDPQLASNASAETVLCNLFEGLLVRGADGSIQNGLAESYEISGDQLQYTFHLREDSFWYQEIGDNVNFDEDAKMNVTADDFVFAFQRLFDPMYASPNAEAFACIKNARRIMQKELTPDQIGVTAKDRFTLVFTLDFPNSSFLTLLTTAAAMPCNAAFFESTKGRYGLDEQSVIGNGSFAMQRWLYDPYGKYNVIQMVRNPLNHKVHRVYPTDLSFYIEETDGDAARIFTEGNTDCYVSTQNTLVSHSEYHTQSAYSITLGLIANPDSHFADINVLASMALTLDRSLIPQDHSDIRPAAGILPPAVTLLNKSCRELISDSGYQTYDPPEADRLYHKALRKLRISELEEGRILVCGGMMDYTVLLDLLEKWGAELDLHFQIEEVTESEYESRLQSGDYALALYAVSGETQDASAVLSRFLTDEHLHCGQQTELRELLNQAASAPNLTDCVEIFRQAEETVLADNCFIPLFYKQRYLVCKKGVEDVNFNPFSGQVQFTEAKFLN